MILALIKNNKVLNVIVANIESIATNYSEYLVVRVDNLNPQPGIGWNYDSNLQTFSDNRPLIEE